MVKIKEILDVASQDDTLNLTTTLKGIIWDPYVVIRTILIFIVTILILYMLFSLSTSIKKVFGFGKEEIDSRNRKKNQ